MNERLVFQSCSSNSWTWGKAGKRESCGHLGEEDPVLDTKTFSPRFVVCYDQ